MNSRVLIAVGAACAILVAPAWADWNPGDPFKMHFPQLPDPNGWDIEIVTAQHEVADDWLCIQTGPVSDIHFWYSVAQDLPTRIDHVTASIYKDVPAGGDPAPLPYSRPGELLWQRTFDASQFTVVDRYGTGNQGFADPQQPNFIAWTAGDHQFFHQVNIAPIDDPFVQQEGTIYWLGLYVTWEGSQSPVGWKTSLEHFQDDAVYRNLDGFWSELVDPSGKSLDMAFVITVPEPAGTVLLVLDFAVMLILKR